jgi:hypothetical protein
MPTACEPCPGKRKASFIDIPETFYWMREAVPFNVSGLLSFRQEKAKG